MCETRCVYKVIFFIVQVIAVKVLVCCTVIYSQNIPKTNKYKLCSLAQC